MQDRTQEFYKQLDLQYAQGDLQGVERFLLESAQDKQNSVGDRIAILNEIGSFYRGTSRYAQSEAAFEQARALTEEHLGRNSVQYATVLNNMAGTYRLMQNYVKAIQLFLESVNIYRDLGMENTYQFASVLNNLSLAYRQTKRLEPAIEYLRQALAIIETMPDKRQEVAITYNNLTAMYYANGQTDCAMFTLNRALQEFEKCSEEENVHYAAGLNSLAGVLYSEGKHEKALEVYRKSMRYTLKFFGENMEYGITCQNMYWVYMSMGRKQEAAAILEKAAAVYERHLGPDHDRTCAVVNELRRLKSEMNA
ncbi:MAG: tetratricopeptide repeat protein [Butyricicoccus sp.]